MANTILIGAQWGDEGKGKIIDVLTEKADIVVRMQGGANAGHTVLIGKKKYILHLIPSGILRKGKICVIGNGVVIDPVNLMGEIDGLRKMGVPVDGNLIISETAHLVMPYHRELDVRREMQKGNNKLGTTKRGIGPAYGDKAARIGLRIIDLIQPDKFRKKLRQRIQENNVLLKQLGARPLSFEKVYEEYRAVGERLRPFVRNTLTYLHAASERNAEILFEGAQGTFLDIDHGTYPYVTSSNTTSGGACTGSGIPPNKMKEVIGVLKAYTTRVGEGPFPTEDSEISDMLHEMGREFGATTGRPRRCGWLDMVAIRHASIINGITELAMTNLDGLDTLEAIKFCVGYEVDGQSLDYVPNDLDQLARCKPVYREFPGWKTSTSKARAWKDLPLNARRYLKAVAREAKARLRIVSVGPCRAETIFV